MSFSINYKQQRPTWIPDHTVSACTLCKQAFSFDVRRHHCRHCGNIFCHWCSSRARALPCLGYTAPVRLCDTCTSVCDVRDTFMDAVRTNDEATASAMLRSGAVRADDSTGTQTPLLVAASKGHGGLLRLLLEHKADVHGVPFGLHRGDPNPRGDTPLHYAAINGSPDTVRLLLERGAEVDRRSMRYGETALHKAVLMDHVDTAGVLLRAGADPCLANERGLSPLTLCAQTGGAGMRGAFGESGHEVTSQGAEVILSDPLISPQARPRLLFQALTALYVYKRAPRARAALCASLVAMHAKGYDLEAFIPQLCDLSLREPPQDPSLKRALLSVAAECPTFAFGAWYFLQ